MAVLDRNGIIIPEVFTEYIDKEAIRNNEFVESGVMKREALYDETARQGGVLSTMPEWADINVANFATRKDGVELGFDDIKTTKEVVLKIYDVLKVGFTSLSAELAGSNPENAISRKLGGKVKELMQARLLQTLKGVFSATSMADSKSSVSLANFGNDALLDFFGILGDNQHKITTIAMHSALYIKLLKANLVNYANVVSEVTGRPIVYLGDKRLIVNDNLVNSTGGYLAYAFRDGAVAYGRGGELKPFEAGTPMHAEKGGITARFNHIFHVHGTSWIGGSNLTDNTTELVQGSNWERAKEYSKKDIGVIQLTVTP